MSNLHNEPQDDTFSQLLMLAAFGSIVPMRVCILRRLPPAARCYLLRPATLNIRRLKRRVLKPLVIKSALSSQVLFLTGKLLDLLFSLSVTLVIAFQFEYVIDE